MFAARAGAKKVIGVDCSDIIHKAREIVANNGNALIAAALCVPLENAPAL